MAKRRRMLPARKPRDRSRAGDSLLLRSAESLGRVIGALQRQLEGATKHLLKPNGEVIERKVSRKRAASKRKRAASKTAPKHGTSKTTKKR